MPLTLRPAFADPAVIPERFAKYEPLAYEVEGLPPTRMIRISRRLVPIEPACWEILPITLVENDLAVSGKRTGSYDSPEDALAAIDAAVPRKPATLA
jgi:hypothetical protein